MIPKNFKGFGFDKSKNWNELKLVEYEHKPLSENDIVIEVECCGVCGTDVHTLKSTLIPPLRDDLVVGHEMVGKVVYVGEIVKDFKVGQRVGIGPMCNSCMECKQCKNSNEQYCTQMVNSYNWVDPHAENYVTQGGYANFAIANENFVFPIPDEIPSSVAAPMMCAGLTVFSPMVRNFGYDLTGKKIGILGIGGLGHLAIQFARALGAEVTAISRSSKKKEDALDLGAIDYIATREDKDWQIKYNSKFDMILNCASEYTSINFSDLCFSLAFEGILHNVGIGSEPLTVSMIPILIKNIKITGSAIGSKKEAIKMFEVAATHNIKTWVEEIPLSQENLSKSLSKCESGSVRYRFVFTNYNEAF